MSLLIKAGITKLSELTIDVDKDWNAKKINNIAEVSVGDIVFANDCRLTEVDDGIALIGPRGQIIRRWTNA